MFQQKPERVIFRKQTKNKKKRMIIDVAHVFNRFVFFLNGKRRGVHCVTNVPSKYVCISVCQFVACLWESKCEKKDKKKIKACSPKKKTRYILKMNEKRKRKKLMDKQTNKNQVQHIVKQKTRQYKKETNNL
jgi:flagellar biosynthesis protein FliP